MIEQHDYEEDSWTKVFRPFVTYIGAPAFSSYITSWCYDNTKVFKNFWLGLLFVIIVFAVVYVLFGGIITSILLTMDRKNTYKPVIRFLQKYCRELRIKQLNKDK